MIFCAVVSSSVKCTFQHDNNIISVIMIIITRRRRSIIIVMLIVGISIGDTEIAVGLVCHLFITNADVNAAILLTQNVYVYRSIYIY